MNSRTLIVPAVALLLGASASATVAGRVTHLEAEAVAAAFAQGRPLLEVENYKVHASRREAPGLAEVHTRDTDIIYVLEGTASLVTGGSLVAGQATATEELRGRAIDGGEERRLGPRDVVVVPAGTPHWFQAVSDPFLYYVVKVRSVDGGAR